MPKYVIRWTETVISTAIVDAEDDIKAGRIVSHKKLTPVHTTVVSREFGRMLSIRPHIDLGLKPGDCIDLNKNIGDKK